MFHAHSNWHFKRNEDGSVHIEHRVQMRDLLKPDHFTPHYFVDAETDIPADVWASIVATVSAQGETGDTWRTARAFHLTNPNKEINDG